MIRGDNKTMRYNKHMMLKYEMIEFIKSRVKTYSFAWLGKAKKKEVKEIYLELKELKGGNN